MLCANHPARTLLLAAALVLTATTTASLADNCRGLEKQQCEEAAWMHSCGWRPPCEIDPSALRSLKPGAEGKAILDMQRSLGVQPSGKFDAVTKKAVEDIQRQNNLPPTGVIDAPTRNSVIKKEAIR